MADTRDHFSKLTRKPWLNSDVNEQIATPAQIAMLKAKPVIREEPYQEIGRVRLPEVDGRAHGFEFVLIIGQQVFYVASEGYSYARYAIRFSNLQPSDFA